MKNFLLLLFVGFALSGMSQSFTVRGTVKSNEGNALEMANLIAMLASDSSMSGFGFTDENGLYKIALEPSTSYRLRVSYLGFETLDVVFTTGEAKGSLVKDIILIKKDETLEEVEVVEEMPIMISGDTISYQADAFNTGTEKKLEDVLENLPGVEVDENGEVTVEGKVVEKVMVEGKDFFDGDTKMATKNIPANAIDKIQVLRNYNDVKPLGGVTNNEDRIAINIKLKEGKKNIFFGDVSAEVGLDSRYLVHPNLFYYTPKASFNFIGDVNNIGKPAFTPRDFYKFSGGVRGINSKTGSSLNVANDLGVNLQQTNNTIDYVSQLGALNFSYNPSKAWTINGFLIGSNTEVDARNRNLNNYVGQDSLASQEVLSTDETNKDASILGKASVKYTPNSKLYLAYDVFTKYLDSRSNQQQLSQFALTDRSIVSENTQNPFEIRQNLEAYYDINAKSILSFEGQYLYKKQDPYYGLLTQTEIMGGPILDTSALTQDRLIKTNKIDGLFSYYYIINNKNHVEFSLGGSYIEQSLNSNFFQVYGDTLFTIDDSLRTNDVRFQLTDVVAGVHYRTKLGKLTVKPGINLHRYETNNLQFDENLDRNWNYVLPDFFAKYDFKKSQSLTLDYKMTANFTDVNQVASGVILQNYNSLFTGNPMLDNAIYHNVSMRFFSFNLFNFTNIFAFVNYNKKIDEITNAVNYIGIDRVNSPINSAAANDAVTGTLGYQRRIKVYKISLRGTWNYSLTNNLIDSQRNSNTSFTQNYKVSFGTNFKKAPNIDVGYKVSLNNYDGTNVSTSFTNHQPYAEFEWYFLEGFLFNLEYRYNNYKASTGPSSVYDFLDARLGYQKENSKWEYYLSATNLLNTEFIRTDSFTNSVTSTQEVFVLPRYITVGVKYDL
jgi:hypothetical protein